MSKKSLIEREKKRKKLVQKYLQKRKNLIYIENFKNFHEIAPLLDFVIGAFFLEDLVVF